MEMQTGYESQSHRASMALNEDVMAELADGSGGTYFHNSNDLEAGFKELATAPEYVYVLELSLDNEKPRRDLSSTESQSGSETVCRCRHVVAISLASRKRTRQKDRGRR